MWALPTAFHPSFTRVPLTYHGEREWSLSDERAIVHSAPIGQEFVVEMNEGIERWLSEILACCGPRAAF